MGKMSWISYLCENEMKEELIKELNMPDLVSLTGKSPEEIADGFIEAHKEIKKRKKEKKQKQSSVSAHNKNTRSRKQSRSWGSDSVIGLGEKKKEKGAEAPNPPHNLVIKSKCTTRNYLLNSFSYLIFVTLKCFTHMRFKIFNFCE